LSFRSIFQAILKEHAYVHKKEVAGAKYPVHVSYVPTLLQWFPECKIIHVIRDPRAIFASQLIKHSGNHQMRKFWLYIPMLIHSIVQYMQSAQVYDQHKDLPNYYLSRYEDVVSRPVEKIKRLCDFLQVSYSSDMLDMPVLDSSYGPQSGRGVSEVSIYKWKDILSPITLNLIQVITKKHMSLLRYI
jgi:hypothetical protein